MQKHLLIPTLLYLHVYCVLHFCTYVFTLYYTCVPTCLLCTTLVYLHVSCVLHFCTYTLTLCYTLVNYMFTVYQTCVPTCSLCTTLLYTHVYGVLHFFMLHLNLLEIASNLSADQQFNPMLLFLYSFQILQSFKFQCGGVTAHTIQQLTSQTQGRSPTCVVYLENLRA